MKKIFIGFVVVAILLGAGFYVNKVSAQAMSFSQLVELFISLGIIPADKAGAARAAVVPGNVNVSNITSTSSSDGSVSLIVNDRNGSLSETFKFSIEKENGQILYPLSTSSAPFFEIPHGSYKGKFTSTDNRNQLVTSIKLSILANSDGYTLYNFFDEKSKQSHPDFKVVIKVSGGKVYVTSTEKNYTESFYFYLTNIFGNLVSPRVSAGNSPMYTSANGTYNLSIAELGGSEQTFKIEAKKTGYVIWESEIADPPTVASVIATLSSKSISLNKISSGSYSGNAVFNVTLKAIDGDFVFSKDSFQFALYLNGVRSYHNVVSSSNFQVPSYGVITSGLSSGQFKLTKNNTITIPVTFTFSNKIADGSILPSGNYAVGLENISYLNGNTKDNISYMSGQSDWRTSSVNIDNDVVNTTQPSITVISPNGGETMVSGEGDNAGGAFTVTWSANYSSSTPVSGSLVKEGSGKVYTVQIASSVISGKSSARLAMLPPGRYKALICAKTICDESDNYFTIKEKVVPPVASCVDSDGGKNIDVAGMADGRVNGLGSYFNDTSVASNGGQCSGVNCTGVAEGYCLDGKVTNTVYQCPSGYSVNGACAVKPVAPVSEKESTIVSFYKTYLGRAGSQSEISYWSDNSLTIDQIKQEFIKSSERKDIVTQMYRDILKREPDAAGLDSLRLADSSIDQIRQAFYNSAEYKALSGGATVMFSIEGLSNLVKALR